MLRSAESRPLGEFTYVPSWLRNDHGRAFALDPENLPLVPRPHVTQKRLCLPGALADATPDKWGRRLIEVTLDPGELPLSLSGWLLATGDDRVGCLTFSRMPRFETPATPYASILDLPAIAAGFERIEAGEPAEPAVQHLFNIVRSLGGARPKATLAHEGSLWIAKFQKSDDEFDQCGVEHATMRMAGLCGIDVPETRVERIGRRRVLLVKRFDRAIEPCIHPNAHFLSALSALDIDDTEERGSYAEIAGFLRRYSYIGRYAWLTMGFLPDVTSWRRHIVPKARTQLRVALLTGMIDRKTAEEAATILNDPDPRAIRNLILMPASMHGPGPQGAEDMVPLLKVLMLQEGTDWNGAYDFRDEESKDLFDSYRATHDEDHPKPW